MIGFGNPVAGEWGRTEHSLSPSIPRSYLAPKWEERKKNFSPFSRLTVERHRVRLEPLVVERHAAEVDAAHLVDEDVERDVSAAVVAPPAPFFPLPEEEDRNESAGSRGIKTDVENAARSRAATGTPSR